jgi:protein TonB
VLPIGGDVVAPVLVHRVDPAYPEWARRIRLEGLLILQAVIGTGGEVQELTVLKSAHPALDAAARDAVRQWRYRPATLNGRLVRVFLTVTVEFRLR